MFSSRKTLLHNGEGRFAIDRASATRLRKARSNIRSFTIIHGCFGYFSRIVAQCFKEILASEVIQRFGVMSCQTQVTKSKQTLLRIVVCSLLGFRRWVTSVATCLSSRPPSKTVHPSRRYLGLSSPASSGLLSGINVSPGSHLVMSLSETIARVGVKHSTLRCPNTPK